MITDTSPELVFILAVLVATPQYSPEEERVDIGAFINNQDIRWDFLYALIVRHRVWHQMLSALNAVVLPIDAGLKALCQQDTQELLAISSETLRLAQVFSLENIQHCFLKGVILNELLYGSINARPCRDIDVWVDMADYQNAIDQLLSMGYQKKHPTYELTGFKKRYYMTHKHDIAFFHPIRGILVELHFTLSHIGLDFYEPTADRCQLLPLCHRPITTLQDDYHLLYLMVHAAVHGWMRLRWLNDIALYVQSNRCSLDNVMMLAKEIRCEHLVEQALILVHDLLGLKHPFLLKIVTQQNKRVRWLVRAAKYFIAMDEEVTEAPAYSKRFIYFHVYSAKIAVSGQKMRAMWCDLFKLDYLFPYMTFPKGLSWMYYVAYPIWVMKYVILG